MRLFFDTSAFAKRYILELGSPRVLELCGQASCIGLAVICLPELISTLCRLVREGRLISEKYHELKSSLLADIADVDMCALTPSALRHTVASLECSPVRAMDAIHLGCAVDYQPDLFVSADQRQIAAALGLGLRVEGV